MCPTHRFFLFYPRHKYWIKQKSCGAIEKIFTDMFFDEVSTALDRTVPIFLFSVKGINSRAGPGSKIRDRPKDRGIGPKTPPSCAGLVSVSSGFACPATDAGFNYLISTLRYGRILKYGSHEQKLQHQSGSIRP